MAQSRDAPAYQEYPANFMARIQYRVMSLAERGLLLTLRHECWVNKQVPADPCTLARMLGYEVDEVAAALPAVLPVWPDRVAVSCRRAIVTGQELKQSLSNF